MPARSITFSEFAETLPEASPRSELDTLSILLFTLNLCGLDSRARGAAGRTAPAGGR